MDASFVCSSFVGGQWSQTAQGAIEKPEYRTAMNVCFNGLPIEEGAWTRRPGTAFGAHTRGGGPARVLSYAFEQEMPYTLEFSDGYLRFYEGSSLAYTNDAVAVSSISTANPAVVTVASAVTWSTGNTVMFNGLGLNNPLLQNRQFTITSITSETFSLQDALTGNNIDGSTLGVFSSGIVSRVLELTVPYVGGLWNTLRLVQGDKSAALFHTDYPPQILAVEDLPTSTSYATFTINPLNFVDGPYLDPPTNGALLSPSGTTGLIDLTVTFAAWSGTTVYTTGDYVEYSGDAYISLIDQNLNNEPDTNPSDWQLTNPATAINTNGFQATDIGRHIRLFSEPPLWASGTSYSTGNIVKYDNVYWTCLSNNTANATNAPGLTTAWGVNPTGAVWTWGKITGLLNVISNSGSYSGNFTNYSYAFNGNLSQSTSTVAGVSNTISGGGTVPIHGANLEYYLGEEFSSGQAIGFVNIYPPSNSTMFWAYGTIVFSNGTADNATPTWCSCNIRLYGSMTSLTASQITTSGVLLGSADPYTGATTEAQAQGGAWGPQFAGGGPPITIISNDTTTAYKYYYLVFDWNANMTYPGGGGTGTYLQYGIQVSQVVFYSPVASSSASGVSVEILGGDLLYSSTPITTWRLGLFNQASAWPTCGTYHEGRLWIAGAVPNRIDASEPDQIWEQSVSFAPTESDGTVTDANGIDYTLNSPDVNTVLWLQPDLQGIIIGSESGEWLVQATTANEPLSPLNIQAHRVTKIGSALAPTAEPAKTELTLVFIQRYARKVMEYFADVFSGKFTAPNLAVNIQNITAPALDALAYQKSLTPVVWARRTDGALLGCSYKRNSLFSSQGPTMEGWHYHTLGTGRLVQYITIGPSVDGTTDTLAMVTTMPGGYQFVEFLTPIFQEWQNSLDAWFVDCGIEPTSYQNTTSGGVTYLTLYGLWPFNSLNVDVWGGGLDLGTWPVTNGSLSIPYGNNPLLTTAFVANFNGAMPIVVGQTYTSQGQLVPPEAPQDTGARNGPGFGKIRRVHRFAAKLVNTQGISFGTTFSNLHTAMLRTYPGGTISLAQNQLFTGVYRDTMQDDNSLDGMLCWQITRPFPATIAAISGAIHTQDV